VLLIGVPDWFPWVKVLSIALGIIMLSIFRTTKLGDTKLCRVTVYVFLVVNILEAVSRDAAIGDIANYLNALAGLLLIVSLGKLNTIYINAKDEYKDLHWGDMTLQWIIGYTLWNWVFVYLSFGFESSIQHVAVLGSALVIAFMNRERWLQARVFTLGTYFIVIHSAPHLSNYGLITREYSRNFGLLMASFSFVFMVVYASRVILAYRGRGY